MKNIAEILFGVGAVVTLVPAFIIKIGLCDLSSGIRKLLLICMGVGVVIIAIGGAIATFT